MILVHLSDVKESIRVRTAERMVRLGLVSGTEALDVKMAAVFPRQNPSIEVSADLARKMCGW